MQICSLLLLLIFITSCTGQDNTKAPENHSKTSPVSTSEKTNATALSESSAPIEDPTFVAVQDTVSMHGPRSITRNVLQDKNGNIWFASWEGILRYDGKQFTNVTLKEGLKHFHVFSVFEDKTGNLWFGTIGGGVYRYDSQSFTLFTTTDGLASNSVMCMMEDMLGNIWLGTDNGLSRYDGQIFTNFTTKDGLSGNFINSIVQDKTGNLWFATRDGVSRSDGNAFTPFTNEKGASFYITHSIIADRTGNIWIAGTDGLCRYDPAASLRTGRKSLTNFAPIAATYIYEDKAGNLWLSGGTINTKSPDMTLTKYDGKSFAKIKRDYQIFGITEDRAGNIWFGTANGVCRYDGKSFNHFK